MTIRAKRLILELKKNVIINLHVCKAHVAHLCFALCLFVYIG